VGLQQEVRVDGPGSLTLCAADNVAVLASSLLVNDVDVYAQVKRAMVLAFGLDGGSQRQSAPARRAVPRWRPQQRELLIDRRRQR
jgi:hypothetical protein